MSRLEQALILDPPTELHFRGPYDDVTTSYLKLTNPTEQSICFKLKTTAPKTYCVRPNTGIIPPKKTISVAVMLQHMDLETAEKNKHKFMVQSIFAPGHDGENSGFNIDNLWRDTSSDQFMNSKLKCVFDRPITSSQPIYSEGSAVASSDAKQERSNASEVSGDAHHTPPKPDLHVEVNRLENENNRLRQLLNELRSENSVLKEEGLRMRVSGVAGRSPESRNLSSSQTQSLVHSDSSSRFSFRNIVLMLIVLIIGIVIGTYQKSTGGIDGLPPTQPPPL